MDKLPLKKNKAVRTSADYSPCRNTMKFYTDEGLVERLTMGASIMCTRGGRITLKTSGQVPRALPPKLVMPNQAMWEMEKANRQFEVEDYIIPDVKAHIREILGIENWKKLDEWADYNEWERTNDWTELKIRVNLVAEYIDEIKQNNPVYVKFLDILSGRESEGSGGYQAVSGSHLGMYQIGGGIFVDIDFKYDQTH